MTIPRVLLVEDEVAHAELIRRSFEDSPYQAELVVARTIAEAREHLSGSCPDLVVADWRLPDGNSLELVTNGTVVCPVVIMTGKGDEETAVEVMKAGALDYVVKSALVFQEMPRIVERSIREWKHITQREKAERALRDSEAHFRSLIENSYDIITVIDRDALVTYVSPSIERLLGFSPGQVIGRSILDLIHPDDRPMAHDRIQTAFHEPGTTQVMLHRCWNAAGDLCYMESVGSAQLNGSEVKGVINSRDVTERTRAEEERSRLESELRQSQRLEAIGQLAGGIAHDFNNLLTVIGGHAELMEHGPELPQVVRESIREIKKAQESAASLTRQLLAFGRRQLLQPVLLDLNVAIRNIQTMVNRVLGEHIELELELSDEIGVVRADAGQIEQILMNLLVNARDALPEGGRIVVQTDVLDVSSARLPEGVSLDGSRYVMLTVRDNGVGMSEAVREHIFEPFFTTKARGKGTGLGLSTVFGIVKQSGGEIAVESVSGQGTAFTIFLPQVEGAVRAGYDSPETEPVQGEETILVVEDENGVRELVCRVLVDLGYTVLAADNAGEAVKIAAQPDLRIDLVVTDLVLPDRNGWRLMDDLKELHPRARSLYMSGYADDSISSAGRTIGPDVAFLAKPFSPAVLSRRIREVLDNQA